MNVLPRERVSSAPALDRAQPVAARWTGALAVLGLGLALMLGLLFREEVVAAVGVWESSTAYNHCWLVLPVAVWLAWSRRDRLAALAPSPLPWAALLALPAAAAWFAAERLGIMEGRQLALIGLVWVLFLGVLGWRVCRAMAGPLLYLVFLVPFGAFITPVLQDITAWIIDLLLGLTSIPHFVDNLVIEIPEGTFLVAEACAGLRFLIAAIAFGALYALVMFRSPGRRLVVMLLSVFVPIVANGIRAFGIVLLGHLLGSAEAGAADHVIYGWLFFSVVILLLILAGLPFREDLDAPPPPVAPARPAAAPRPGPLALACGLVLLVAAVGPAVAASLQGSWGLPTMPSPSLLALRPQSGCVAEGPALRCATADGPLQVAARLYAFPPGASWGAVTTARTRVLGELDEHDSSFSLSGPEIGIWRGTLRRDPAAPRAIATAVWIGGAASGGGLRSRLDQALGSLRPGGGAPVLLVVEAAPVPETRRSGEPGSRAEGALLRALLADQGAALASAAAAESRPAR